MSNKEEKGNQSQKILDAAFRCISAKGYANVSLRDVAEEAGVVLSQLNYYYKNKEGLFSEVIKALKQEYLASIERNLKEGITVKEKVAFLIEFSQKIFLEKTELSRMLFDFLSMAVWCEPYREQLQAIFDELAELLGKYVSNEISANAKLNQFSVKEISRMLLAAIFGIGMQYVIEPENKDIFKSLNMINVLIES